MGFRIRKSVKIAPGIKLNIGKKGVNSVSIGGHGYTKNISKKGTRTTISAKRTGISYTNYKPYNKDKNVPKESKIERATNKLTELAGKYRECPIDNKQDKIKLPKIIWKEFIITGLFGIATIIFIPMAAFMLISALVTLCTLLFNKQCWAQMFQCKAIKAYHFGDNQNCIRWCESSLRNKEYESTRRLMEIAKQEIS